MNERQDDNLAMQVDERVELLINRSLDGRLSPEQEAELHAALEASPAARALLETYSQNDALVARALDRGIENAMTATAPGRRRGSWLATAGGILSAAAVILFSVSPLFRQPNDDTAQDSLTHETPVVIDEPVGPARPPTFNAAGRPGLTRLVDYRDDDGVPEQRQRRMDREWVGIRGDDGRIYILQRNTASTRIAPMSGEY